MKNKGIFIILSYFKVSFLSNFFFGSHFKSSSQDVRQQTYANNEDSGQPAHPRSLNGIFTNSLA